MLAIKGGKVVTVTNGTIENGVVLIEGTKIKAVGADVEIPAGAKVIDATGKWVTPGLIDAHTHISTFNEPQAVQQPGTVDGNEVSGPVTAHIRALDALNPFDMGIEHARKAGFTTCFTLPGSANVIGGIGLSFKLKEGSTVFDLVIPGTEHMKMALGENPKRVYGSEKKMPVTRMGVGAVLRESLYNAKVYAEQLELGKTDPSKAPKPDFKLEALVPVVKGEMKCRIHAHRADDIVTAVRIAQEFNLKFAVEHATESHKILDFLKENNIECVIGPLTMGYAKMEIWGRKFETAGILEKAGITFCLSEDAASSTKYLPTHVGFCIARGLSLEEAFRSVTITAAKILELDHRVGSLEPGKDADVAIFNGNPFSNFTLCEKTIIDGEVYENEVAERVYAGREV
ncbi:MAG: amidohydrolase [Defluviitaleaceae bacterium]|nr:amidohydrolase [Defluviitaleaceae bacterium]